MTTPRVKLCPHCRERFAIKFVHHNMACPLASSSEWSERVYRPCRSPTREPWPAGKDYYFFVCVCVYAPCNRGEPYKNRSRLHNYFHCLLIVFDVGQPILKKQGIFCFRFLRIESMFSQWFRKYSLQCVYILRD